MLQALKNLDSMFLKELVGTLKVHEQEVQLDEGLKKRKVSGYQQSADQKGHIGSKGTKAHPKPLKL